MKSLFSVVSGFIWMSIISIGACVLLLWLAPYCFFSEWWKVIVFLIFGVSLFKVIWNAVVPIVAVVPVSTVAKKMQSWNSTMISAAIPSIFAGLYCLYVFWFKISADMSFDVKDWITSIAWTYIAGSCFFHLSFAFLSMISDKQDVEDNLKIS